MSDWLAVIDYWFGSNEPPSSVHSARWFSGGPETDSEIQAKFAGTHQAVTSEQCEHWLSEPLGRLAAIITIDQFSRNLYRGKADAFAWDHLALHWSIEGWQNHTFDSLTLSQKLFAIMPLMHSENPLSQDYTLALLSKIEASTQQPNEMLSSFYSSANEHRDIIRQFGRYPHRNHVLGRASTPAETRYLSAGAKRFGQ